jgi:hypothetical protein
VHADLFAKEGGFTPRPAWQVIEAARRQLLTGELSLATTPTTHVYLRDGQIYFAERTTDGGLGVRLLVEGVITRQQMGKGALLVSGVEHLGRMFQRDTTIDQQSVELCVELMTDDVLTAVANDVIDHYTMTMYKRHPNGIDRWLPTRIEVITHIVDGAHLAEPDAEISDGPVPRRRTDAVAAAASAPAAVVQQPPAPSPALVDPPAGEAAPVEVPVIVEAPAVAAPVIVEAPAVAAPVIAPAPITATPSIGGSLAAAAAAGLLDTPAPMNAEALFADPPLPTEPAITLAQSAVDLMVSCTIADEVAEAVRRALAAVDAAVQPPAMSPGDFSVRASTMKTTPTSA